MRQDGYLKALQGITTLKLFNAGRREASVVARLSEAYRSSTMRVLRVAFLSPAVTAAILAGKQHGALTATRLRQTDGIPMDWQEQAELFLPTRAAR